MTRVPVVPEPAQARNDDRVAAHRLDRAVQAQRDTIAIARHPRRQCPDQSRQGQNHPGRANGPHP